MIPNNRAFNGKETFEEDGKTFYRSWKLLRCGKVRLVFQVKDIRSSCKQGIAFFFSSNPVFKGTISINGQNRQLERRKRIRYVIPVSQDAPYDRLVMDLDGRPTARFMFFNGLSRTRKTGDISYLYNEYQEENLAFSFQMKLKAEEYYPGLTRKNYLKGYRYNMHLRPKTLLVELGAQNNTVEEAMNACEPLAHILDMVLTGQ